MNFALSPAITTSPVSASPMPPPTAVPRTPTTTGLSSVMSGTSQRLRWRKRRCTGQGSHAVCSILKSPPEQKVGPSAVRNTERTARSRSALSTASPSCSRSSVVRELRFSGLQSRITRTDPSFAVLHHLLGHCLPPLMALSSTDARPTASAVPTEGWHWAAAPRSAPCPSLRARVAEEGLPDRFRGWLGCSLRAHTRAHGRHSHPSARAPRQARLTPGQPQRPRGDYRVRIASSGRCERRLARGLR